MILSAECLRFAMCINELTPLSGWIAFEIQKKAETVNVSVIFGIISEEIKKV